MAHVGGESQRKSTYKGIRVLLDSPEVPEGLGGVAKRPIGSANLRHLDPFLFFDHFSVNPPHGFPKHPHRGFEAILYIVSGSFKYENSLGSSGVLSCGDAQRMVVGRGILHAEQAGAEGTEGLMLWVNQVSSEKFCAPSTVDVPARQVPKSQVGGVKVEVIAGHFAELVGPCSTSTPIQYLIVHMLPGTVFQVESPEAFSTILYVLSGQISIQSRQVSRFQVAVLENVGCMLSVHTSDVPGGTVASFVLLQGPRIGEPIVRQGPYVMNLREECLAARIDYSNGQNGFEDAQLWHPQLNIE